MDEVPLLFEYIPYDTVTDNIDEAELSEQGNQEGSSLPAHFEPHGADKDSEKRQRAAIEAYTKTSGYEIAETFYDAAVSGADPVSERSGFAEMLERLMSNGARTIIVESPDRFARDLMVLAGHDMLNARGVTLIAASAPTRFVEDTPTAVLVRQAWAPPPSSKRRPLSPNWAARRRKRSATGKKVDLPGIDIVSLARGYGCDAARLDDIAAVKKAATETWGEQRPDRKSTRLNSSHRR